MNKLSVLIPLFFLVACQQQPNDTPKAEENTQHAQSAEPSFNCAEYKDSFKEIDPNIQVIQNIREINENEKNAISYSAKMTGHDVSNGYVLDQKVPGKILGICVAEAFFADSTNHNLIFTVSDVDGKGYIAYQDYAPLQLLAMVMPKSSPVSQQEISQNTTNPENVQQQTVTNETHENESKVSQDTVKHEAQVATVATPEAKVFPSFNCDKASTPVEKMICSNSNLADLDNIVASSYQQALKNGTESAESLRTSQREWLKIRNACQTVECVAEAHEKRHKDLAPWDYD